MRMSGREPGMSFYIIGSDDQDSLSVEADIGKAPVTLRIPVAALPWRDLELVERHGPRDPFGCGERDDPVAVLVAELKEPGEITDRTGILGASRLRLDSGVAEVELAPGGSLTVSCLRIAPSARMSVAVQVGRRARRKPRGTIRIGQLSGGRRIGGVTLQLGEGPDVDRTIA